MKECYFCSSIIPENATTCPMCGLDLTEVETPQADKQNRHIHPAQSPTEKKEVKQAREDANLNKIGKVFGSYFIYYFKKITHPVSLDQRTERHPFFGYLNILLASFFSAGIITRVAAALDDSYQFMVDISILPTITFELKPFEWFWKYSLFFILFFLLLTLITFLFKKMATNQPLDFHNWVTQFTGTNALYFLLLFLTFLVTMVAPIALAVPALLMVLLYIVSQVLAFIVSLYDLTRAGKENKTYYQVLFGISVHLLVMTVIGYLLMKI